MRTNWQFKMASWFPENFPEAIIAEKNEEATPLNTIKVKKKFDLGVLGAVSISWFFKSC